jgi:hypothetical protein
MAYPNTGAGLDVVSSADIDLDSIGDTKLDSAGGVEVDAGNIMTLKSNDGMNISDALNVVLACPNTAVNNAAVGYYNGFYPATNWQGRGFENFFSSVAKVKPPKLLLGVNYAYKFSDLHVANGINRYSIPINIPPAWMGKTVWFSVWLYSPAPPDTNLNVALCDATTDTPIFGVQSGVVTTTWVQSVGSTVIPPTMASPVYVLFSLASGAICDIYMTGIQLVQQANAPSLILPNSGEIDVLSGVSRITAGNEASIQGTNVDVQASSILTLQGLAKQGTVGAAGGGSALPATPDGYMIVDGFAVPYYDLV